MNAGDGVKDKAKQVGRRADDHDWIDTAVRFGMVTYGVVHLMIAWLAVQLAFGESSGSASSKGALRELAQQPFGQVLVWLIAVGMLLLVLWRLLEAVAGHRDEDGGTRLRKGLMSLAKAVIYGAIGVSALKVAMGIGGGGSGSDGYTAS